MQTKRAMVVLAGLLVATVCGGMEADIEKTALINVYVKEGHVLARVCYEPSGKIAHYPWPASGDEGRFFPFLVVDIESGELAARKLVIESGSGEVHRDRIVGWGVKCTRFNLSDAFILEAGKSYQITYSFLFSEAKGNIRKSSLVESNAVTFLNESNSDEKGVEPNKK